MQMRKSSRSTKTGSVKVEKAIEDFLYFKSASGKASRTIADYRLHLEKYFRSYDYEYLDYERLETVVLKDFEKYRDKSAAYYNLHYAYVHAFFNWIVDRNYIDANPITRLKLKKRRVDSKAKNIPEMIIGKLLDAIDVNTYVGLRDYALTVLTMDTGIRPGEALATREEDYDLDSGVLVVRSEIAKTRTRREIPLSRQTCEVLKILCSHKPKGFCQNMFCSWEGEPISTHSWYLRLREYSEQINYKVRPYDLRHSFAVQFVKCGGSAFALQRLLGHSNMNMCQHYVNLADSDIKEQQAKSSPIHQYVKRTTKLKRIK